MRNFALPLMMATCLSVAAPVQAQSNLGDVVNGVAQSLLSQEVDKRAYVAAQNANTVQAYRSYLAQFPKGLYRTNAERALAQLGVTVNPGTNVPPVTGGTLTPAQQEAALGLNFSQRVAIQRRLTALGFDTRGADGAWGYNTRTAIANWQASTRQTATAYLTLSQANVLLQGQTGPVVTPPTGGGTTVYAAAQAEAALGLSRTQRITIQTQLNRIGYNTGTPDGLWGSNTRKALAKWQTANRVSATGYVTGPQVNLIAQQAGGLTQPTPTPGNGANAALQESLLSLTPYEKADLQRRLTRLGYNTYGADGVLGQNSRTAIARWQGDEGLKATGYFTADQVRKIRVETGG
jgi:peptidoglycan hydrolase-like protein with peptidoglycan-binding domain